MTTEVELPADDPAVPVLPGIVSPAVPEPVLTVETRPAGDDVSDPDPNPRPGGDPDAGQDPE